MGLLSGKNILVTGVLTEASIAFHVAKMAQLEGATVVLTGFGRLSLVRRIAQRLPQPAPVVELDVTQPPHLERLAGLVGEHIGQVDGLVHAIANAPPTALGGNFLKAPWPDVAATLNVSTYSLAALATAVLPILGEQSSIVGLDFDATVAWSGYDWMGVAKAGLESCARYLARHLGPRGARVNLVAAGPLNTMAARHIPGFGDVEALWDARAPLGWKAGDIEPVARTCVALLSDWMPATTGEIVHADGGVHAMGD